MSKVLHRSIDHLVRIGLDWHQSWEGPDEGLIYCWELGRQLRHDQPELAKRAADGELVGLPWKGGTTGLEPKHKAATRFGTLQYLAMWQGLRDQDLDIALDVETRIGCARSKRVVKFRWDQGRDHSEI